jgi:extradiol dioxygenase family protein
MRLTYERGRMVSRREASRSRASLPRPARAWQNPVVAVPFVVEELDHVVLRCSDQPRMLEFYVGVLGLAEERRLDHICLVIAAPDMDAVVAYLSAAGVETIGDPMVRYGARGYGLSVYCRDPEGNVVELKCAGGPPPPT